MQRADEIVSALMCSCELNVDVDGWRLGNGAKQGRSRLNSAPPDEF